jgi:hypothetical protein
MGNNFKNLNNNVINMCTTDNHISIEKTLVRELNKRGSESFNLENYKITKKTNKLIRNTIDSEGICLNF